MQVKGKALPSKNAAGLSEDFKNVFAFGLHKMRVLSKTQEK
jgi:hypothetical protein